MRVKVARWGNSVAVRLPKELADRFHLRPGSTLEIDVGRDGFHAKPAPRRRIPDVPTLEEMVAEMKRLGPENEPEMVDWGPDVGSEIIDDEYSRGEITLEDLLGDSDDAARRRRHRLG